MSPDPKAALALCAENDARIDAVLARLRGMGGGE